MSVVPCNCNHTTEKDNLSGESESFHKFFECWISEQKQHLKDLLAAASTQLISDEELHALNDKVVEHYEYYYKAKSRCAKQDVLAMLSPTWMSSLEEAFLWIGGWRPSMAFHLIYSKSGLQFEARLDEVLQGLRTHDLGDLSASQLAQLDEMQRRTILEEREITDLMARHQETVADASMVELSHVVSEMIRANQRGEVDQSKEIEDKVESTLVLKEEGLEKILLKADELRFITLKDVVDVLTPKQAIHFLIAAAELHLRLHEWGKKMDARKCNQGFGEVLRERTASGDLGAAQVQANAGVDPDVVTAIRRQRLSEIALWFCPYNNSHNNNISSVDTVSQIVSDQPLNIVTEDAAPVQNHATKWAVKGTRILLATVFLHLLDQILVLLKEVAFILIQYSTSIFQ
ncbi:Protein DOG1-like 3 [Glycine soja]